jgi:FAD/FMN-containing dehydrogenase
VHMQLGKAYPYMRGRESQSTALIRQIKTELDPKGLMNPGGLKGLTD